MDWHPARFILALSIAVGTAVPARAADFHNVLVDYAVTSWSEKDGLPAGTIWALAQDNEGYLWLGGDAGLSRFDGSRFVSWDALGRPPLMQPSVRALLASRDGSLWIGFGARGGVSRLRAGQLQNYGEHEGLPAGALSALVEDTAGRVWASGSEGLFKFADDRWQRQPIAPGLNPGGVQSAYASRRGDLFVSTVAGIFRQPKGEDRFEPVERSNEGPRAVAEDASGRLWVTDRTNGFRRLGQPSDRDQPQHSGKGFRLLPDRSGNLWISTSGQGLWRASSVGSGRSTAIEHVADLTSVSDNVAYALLEDREGNIWAGTTTGLTRLTQHRITQLTNVGAVTGLEVDGGSVWAATGEGLLHLVEQDGGQVRTVGSAPRIRPESMQMDEDHVLWLSTDQGLLRMDARAGSDAPMTLLSPAVRRVKSIASDTRRGVWLYDLDRGLVHWANGRLEAVAFPSSLQHSRVMSMLTDRSGRTWIGFTQGELSVIEPDGRFRLYGTEDGYDGGVCRVIYQDRDGIVWVGGSRGLGRYADGHFSTLAGINGIPMESVTGIVEDDLGGLWLGTASGIVRIDRRRADNAVLYGASDDIAGTINWTGQRSAIRTQSGRLWFLTAHGVAVVDPRALQNTPPLSPVRIESVLVNEKRWPVAGSRQLPTDVTRLEIDYTLLNLTSPLKTRFRYRLEGFDTDWIDARLQRQAIYTNLPPRAYRFRVEAANADGTWGGTTAAWGFSVRPAFYETAWFYLVAAATLVLLVWSVWRLRLARVRSQFSLLLRERVRLGREIHDTLLQSLVGVALQLDLLANDVGTPGTASRQRVTDMRKQVEDYIREARESIWNLRSSALTRDSLAAALKQAGDRATENGMDFEFRVTGAPHACDPRTEEQLLRIGREAVTNAIRHSRARTIRLDLQYEPTSVTLRVSDDGCGFDASHAMPATGGHWGMTSMKERTEAVGGTFRVVSAAAAGTQVETVVPLSQSF